MKIIAAFISAAALASTLPLSTTAFAADEYNVPKGTTVDGHGIAFRGNDVVAIATGYGVLPGQARYTHVHDGVAYYFVSKQAMDQFAAAPEKYMPQFGGFCAYGVALGKKLDGSPRFADIVDGKLYVFLNAAVFETYKKDKAGVIAKAEKSWPGMHHRPVAEVNS